MENQAQPQGADNDAAKAAIATRNEQDQQVKATLSTLVQKYATGLLGDQRAAQFAAQLMILKQEMPKLAECSNDSIMSAMMACVHVDVMPNTPQQEAYIIPYGNKATFQMGYKGLKELAYRTGQVQSLNGELVFKGDTFDVEFGSERKLTHKPDLNVDRSNPTAENVTHVYITAVLANGEKPFFVMTTAEIEKIREFAKSKNQGKDSPAWKQWWGQQALKTVLKRAAKMLPSSSKDNRFQAAVYYDSLAEAGKLKFDERTGTIIEGEVNDEPPTPPPAKEIKNYAAPQTTEVSGHPLGEPETDTAPTTAIPAEPASNEDLPSTPSAPVQAQPEAGTDNDAQPPNDTPAEAESQPDNSEVQAAPEEPKLSRQDMIDQTNDACQFLGIGYAEKMRKYKEMCGSSNVKNLTDGQIKEVFNYYTNLALEKTNSRATE